MAVEMPLGFTILDFNISQKFQKETRIDQNVTDWIEYYNPAGKLKQLKSDFRKMPRASICTLLKAVLGFYFG